MIADVTAKPRLTAMLRLTATFRRGWLVVLGSLLGLIAVLLAATPASAHAVLVRTNPTQGSVVDQPPAQVVLTFSESVRAVPGKVRVIAPDGSRADSDAASTSGNQLIIGMRPDGGPGTYLVTFRVLSADSHPVAGTFTYSVGAPSTPPSADAAVAEASGFVTAALPVTRWVGYVGLLLVVGAVLVLGLLWPRRLDRRGPARVLWLGVVLAGVATVAELLLQVPYVAGGGLGAIDAAGLREVLATQFGAAHVIRLGVLAAAVLLLRPISQGRGWGADRVLLAVLGAIAVATWSVSGHPSGSSVPMVSIVADMIHLSAMSVWVGGLVMLVAFLLVQANGPELAAIVPVWSRWATYAVGALVVTGLVQVVVNVGTPGALVSTTYGWRLIIKVGLVAAVLVVALLTRRLVGPVTGQADGAARRLRMLVGVEALVAAAVLAMTSVLVQTTPARTAAAEATNAPSVQDAVLRDPLFTLTVDIEPATVGANQIHLYATTPDGQPADIKQWRVQAVLPEQGIEPIQAAVLPVTAGHAIGQVGLPTAGTWTFSFTLRTSDIDQATVRATFVVR